MTSSRWLSGMARNARLPSASWAARCSGVNHSVEAMSPATIGPSSDTVARLPWIAWPAAATYSLERSAKAWTPQVPVRTSRFQRAYASAASECRARSRTCGSTSSRSSVARSRPAASTSICRREISARCSRTSSSTGTPTIWSVTYVIVATKSRNANGAAPPAAPSGWPQLLVVQSRKHVQPRRPAGREERRPDTRDHRDRGKRDEARRRHGERHVLLRELVGHRGREQHPEREPEGRTDQGRDDRLVPDHAPRLATGQADGPEHPDLARPLEDGQHQRVDHAEQAHDDAQGEQRVKHVQDVVQVLRPIGDELGVGEHLRVRELLRRALQAGAARCV